jgi:hypothetical protein
MDYLVRFNHTEPASILVDDPVDSAFGTHGQGDPKHVFQTHISLNEEARDIR